MILPGCLVHLLFIVGNYAYNVKGDIKAGVKYIDGYCL